MSFIGLNTLWKLRRRHGRPRMFDSAEALLQAAESYFDWCDNNPLTRVKFAGHDNLRVEMPVPRPYTISGLCLHLNVNPTYWRQLRQSKSIDESYRFVIDRIDDIIYIQKFEGAAVGVYNANIISRDLGLADRHQSASVSHPEQIIGIVIY